MKKADLKRFQVWWNENRSTLSVRINPKDIDDYFQEIQPKKTIEDRKQDFYNSLLAFKDDYPAEMLREFFDYWTEHGEKDRKFRKEKQTSFNLNLRLKRWFRNYKPKTPTTTGKRPMTITERLINNGR